MKKSSMMVYSRSLCNSLFQIATKYYTYFQSSLPVVRMGSNGDLSLKWNPKNLEIKTRTVERTLEPLVMQVSKINHIFGMLTSIPSIESFNLLPFVHGGFQGDHAGLLQVAPEEEGQI